MSFWTGFGWMKEVGHIDFYPNGGENQPGCPPETFSELVSTAYYSGISGNVFDINERVIAYIRIYRPIKSRMKLKIDHHPTRFHLLSA